MNGTARIPNSAMILAAGFGLRMHPITLTIPKPLVKVANKTLIQYNLDSLVQYGINNVIINVHYLADEMENYLKMVHEPKIFISREEGELLDSGGGIKAALAKLGNSPFFVLNADSFWVNGASSNLERLAKSWNINQMDCLLLLAAGSQILGYSGTGDFLMDTNGQLMRRPEKIISPFVYAGVAIINPQIFKDTPKGPFSLNVLFDRAIAAGRLYGLRLDGDWFHIGTPKAIFEAEQRLLPNEKQL